jgi:menaquinol-cytochrome c reductase iron-sulfur subunit
MTNCSEEHKQAEPAILPDWKKVFVDRQEFLKLLSLALGGLVGVGAAIPGVAFIFNFFFMPKNPEWINVGQIDKFKEGETVAVGFHDPYVLPWDGVSSHRSAWLRRVEGENFKAYAVNCTHLGCPVRWEANAELFLCPCHGGVYYSDGEVAGGPPPRPLHNYPVRVSKRGDVEIQVGPVLIEV